MDIREASDEDLLDALKDRGIHTIKTFSDTELNNEMTRRRHEAEKRYEAVMAKIKGLT